MSKIFSVEFSWDTKGTVNPKYQKYVSLSEDEEHKFISFCPAALLLKQLCVFIGINGISTCNRTYQALTGNYKPEPIQDSLISARMDLLASTNGVFATFYPKIKLFSRNAEQGASTLTVNFIKRLLRNGVGEYSNLLITTLLSIIVAYQQAGNVSGNSLSPAGDYRMGNSMRAEMRNLSITYYLNYWINPRLDISDKEVYEMLERYKGVFK